MRRALLAILGIAALLRFGTLSARGFWGDELSTVFLVREPFGAMLHSIRQLESTPPLYYALAWVWAKVFGTAEAGMRSLTALLGVGTVAAVYAAARELVSRRSALVAAALVAVNPLLVWYSQDARSYSLLVFLSATGLYLFARALRTGGWRTLIAWALVSSLALATHYFALFLVVAEAVVLVRTLRGTRVLAVPLLVVAAAQAALVPLLLHQRSLGHASWIAHSPLVARAVSVPAEFAFGFDDPAPALLGVVGTLLAAAGAVFLLKRARGRDRGGARLAAGLFIGALALPFALALAGLDYFNARNGLPALLPGTIALAVGFAAARPRAGRLAGGLLASLSVGVVLVTAGQPKFHSEDWRSAAGDLDPAAGPRVVVAAPGQAGRKPLEYYLGASPVSPAGGAVVREVDVVALPRQGQSRIPKEYLRRLFELELPGFGRPAVHAESDFALLTFRSGRAHAVSAGALQREVDWGAPTVLLESPPVGTRRVVSTGRGRRSG